MKDTTRHIIESSGLIPVLRAKSLSQAHAVVRAMLEGGVRVVEVTMTVPGAIDLIRELRHEYGSDLLLGSGTVTTPEDAAATIAVGSEFVVSPSLHPDVIEVTREHGKVSIPGALTPTEVITAWRAGADYVKIFPCSAMGGPGYLKSLLAPFPYLQLIPTGGVTLQSAESFLNAGACALGVGSDLVNLQAIESGNPEIITRTAKAYMEIMQKVRSANQSI